MVLLARYGAALLLLLAAWKAAAVALQAGMLPPPEAVFRAFGAAVKTGGGRSAWRWGRGCANL